MKRLLALLVTLCLFIPASAFAALEPGQVVNADPADYSHIDLSAPYQVDIYLVGDPEAEDGRIVEEVNKILQEKYNTTIKLTYLGWDYGTTYGLALAGGEKVDAIYTAPWCYMFEENRKGSFFMLDDAFIEQNMPLTWKYQPKESWGEVLSNGKYMAITCAKMQAQGKYVAIRDDMRVKYGLDELKNWDDFVNYCLTIAEKETPESGVFAIAADNYYQEEFFRVYYQQYDMVPVWNEDDVMYAYKDGGALPDAADLQYMVTTDIFRSFCHDMKKLASAGAWSRSSITNSVSMMDSFANLTGAAIAWNGSVFNYMRPAEQNEGVVCAAYVLTPDNVVMPEAYSNSCMAITAKCENKERTAMILDILSYDEAVNTLIMNGIKDEHYVDMSDGKWKNGPAYENYRPQSSCLTWWVKNGNWVKVYDDQRQETIDRMLESKMVAKPTTSFVFDPKDVQSQVSAVTAVKDEYFMSLCMGLVPDVDTAIDEMTAKLNAAGLQTIMEEMRTQYDAWKAAQ